MAEELKRHGITFSLDLNKHPKDATNLSLINAENFKISEDGASLVSDKSLLENKTIKNKLNEYYKNIHFDIIHCISTNDEIVLFIASNYIKDIYYDLDLFRYSEKLDTCSDSIIPSEYDKMKYYGGKFSATSTYNIKNELIIAFCEYDSILQTEFEFGEPLKIINLGYWEKNVNEDNIISYNIINTNNLNPKTFPICPEVRIPKITNDSIVNGVSKKGWYHFYIRYKIDDYNYTQWFDFGKSFYIDEIDNKTIFDYRTFNSDKTDVQIKLNAKISNDYDICNKTIQFKLNGLCNLYKYYQLGFICSTKIYTDCKITTDININNDNYFLNYSDCDNYDINYFIKTYKNYYNVKNIISYNNRIYIGNYYIKNIKNIYENIKYEIIKEDLNYEADLIKIHFNDEIKTINGDLTIKNILSVNEVYTYNSKNIIEDIRNDVYNLENITPYIKSLLSNNNTNNYIQLTHIYAKAPAYSGNKYYILDVDINNINIYNIINQHKRYFANNRLEDVTLTYIKYNNLQDISEYEYNIENGYIVSKNNYNVDNILYGIFDNLVTLPYSLETKYLLLNSKVKDDYTYTLIPNQPYVFYIHYIDKYGDVTDGIPICNNITVRDGQYYVLIRKWYISGTTFKACRLYYNLSKKLFLNYSANTLDELIDIKNSFISIIANNSESIVSDIETIKNYIKNSDITEFRNLINNIYLYEISDTTCGKLYTFVNEYRFEENVFELTNSDYIPYYADNVLGLYINYSGLYKYKIKFNNIILPKEYCSYFISYVKLEKTLIHQGYYKYNKLYNDNLNYKDNISIIGRYDENGQMFKSIKYNIANSIIDDNYGQSTNIELVDDADEFNFTKYLFSDILNKYMKHDKLLIRISEITDDISTELYTYSFISNHSAIIINKNYRINNRNRLVDDNQNEITDNNIISIQNVTLYGYINESSKKLNNKPKLYKTIVNDVKYDEPNAEFYDSYLFLPQDTVDLFKNDALDYDESILSIYSNYNEININQTNFIKTIRRSTYIKDESLENGWRRFEEDAYQNIQENKGEITRLEGIGDLLLVHTKDSLFQFDKSNLLITANKNVQLAQGDTFDVSYKEIFTSPFGYGGLQDKEAAIVGEFGYIWYNNDFNKIYQYDAGSLNVISGNIEFLLNRYKPTKCKFVDDKYNKRLLIQFQLQNNQVLNLTYNYDIKAFISFYINENSENNLINETYNTKTRFYILENNKIFSGFENPNAKKLSFIINENYTKIKRLNYIKYKLYKRINSSNKEFNANLPVEGNALSIINNRRPYSGYKLKVYNDLCSTEELDIQTDYKENINDIKKPYYDLGNFTFNYLRDKETNSQIFGNFFIVEFTFEDNQMDIIEFESLEYNVNYEEN